MKNYSEIKDVVVNFVDADTGEILFDGFKRLPIRCDDSLSNYLQKCFDSYKRGIHQRNIAFLCEVRDVPKLQTQLFTSENVY